MAEFWISVRNSHAGMRYGILLENALSDKSLSALSGVYTMEPAGENSYLEVQVHSGRNEVKVFQCADGIRLCLLTKKLGKDFVHTVPHRFRVEKRFDKYEIQIDGIYELSFRKYPNVRNYGENAVGIIPYFTELRLHSFDLAYGMILEKEDIQYLREIYDVSSSIMDEEGLRGCGNLLSLTRNREMSDFTEEFQIKAMDEDAGVVFQWEGGEENCQCAGMEEYSVYYFNRDGKEWLMIDGELRELPGKTRNRGKMKICLNNCRITAYRLTKIKNKTQNNRVTTTNESGMLML